MTVVTVTDQIVLLPIKPAPLPYNYRFTVQFSSSKIRKQDISVGLAPGQGVSGLGSTWSLADQDIVDPCGFSKLLRGLFNFVELHNLWGQTLQFCANYPQPGSGVMVSMTASAPQSLRLPRKPVLVPGSAKDRVDTVASLPCVSTSPPLGHRLLWTQLPSFPTHNAWFVSPDNRLAEAKDVLGFNRYSFWISALGLPIKASMNIQTGEAFAQLIKADRQPRGFTSPQATVAQIIAAAGSNAWIFESCIFWNTTRLLFYMPMSGNAGFYEYGTGGYAFLSLSQFASGQSQGSPWNLRLYPKPSMTTGLSSVM